MFRGFRMRQVVRALAIGGLLLAGGLFGGSGCGIFTTRPTQFDNLETGEDGQTYILDDLKEVANDPDLTDDEKRQKFRDMGILDEDLINALLQL